MMEKQENFEQENLNLPMIVEQIEENNEAIEQLTDLEIHRQKANQAILAFTAAAGATGAIPVPLADAPLLIAQQVAMLAKISDVYQINLKKNGLKSLVFTVLGVSGTTVLGRTISAGLLKLIPGIGSLGGATVSGSTAALLTGALGKAYSQVCESVFLGDLEESDLLEYRGRHLLETAFQNEMRLAMKKDPHQEWDSADVLKQTSVPGEEEVISMENHTETPSDAQQIVKNEAEEDKTEA